jgi:ABC-type nickel/cobalt efflux system permease component RcnA
MDSGFRRNDARFWNGLKISINQRLVVFLAVLLGLVCLGASGFFRQFSVTLLMMTQDWQRLFHDEIAGKLRLIKETHSVMATGGLVLVGFLYGALHAVGPGHGKVVVSSYLLASKSTLRRGVIITFLSALLQACVAIALVFGLTSLLGLTRAQAEQTALTMENISFGLILMIGLVLLGRGIKETWWLLRQTPTSHCPCCGVAPDPKKLEKADGFASLAAMIISIGLRPCSGGILILLFSGLVGAYGAGVLAIFAMALGTALTTGGLAVLTVQSKALALRLTESSGNNLRLLHAGLGIAGGLLIIILGTAFLSANTTNAGFAAQSDGMAAAQQHPLMKGFSQ